MTRMSLRRKRRRRRQTAPPVVGEEDTILERVVHGSALLGKWRDRDFPAEEFPGREHAIGPAL